MDTRPESRSADSKKSDPVERNPAKDPLARMEKTLRLHCINLQMAVSKEKYVSFIHFPLKNTVFRWLEFKVKMRYYFKNQLFQKSIVLKTQLSLSSTEIEISIMTWVYDQEIIYCNRTWNAFSSKSLLFFCYSITSRSSLYSSGRFNIACPLTALTFRYFLDSCLDCFIIYK
jgi:hypothetical protein